MLLLRKGNKFVTFARPAQDGGCRCDARFRWRLADFLAETASENFHHLSSQGHPTARSCQKNKYALDEIKCKR